MLKALFLHWMCSSNFLTQNNTKEAQINYFCRHAREACPVPSLSRATTRGYGDTHFHGNSKSGGYV